MLEAGLLRLWIVFFAGMGGSLPAGLDQEGRIEVEGLGGFLLSGWPAMRSMISEEPAQFVERIVPRFLGGLGKAVTRMR